MTVEQLELELHSNAESAVSGIEALASSLGKLKTAVKGGAGLRTVANQISTLDKSLSKVSDTSTTNLDKLANSLKKISECSSIKISASIGKQLSSIGNAVQGLTDTNFSKITELGNALKSLNTLGKSNLNSFVSQLQKVPLTVANLKTVNLTDLHSNIASLISAMSQLGTMGKSNLNNFINSLNKLPAMVANLKKVDFRSLYNQIQSLVRIFKPLAVEMEKVAKGFMAMPSRLQRLIQSNKRLETSNAKVANSYVTLGAKAGFAYMVLRRLARELASWITESNQYIENLNLFSVSMGEYAKEAKRYAETVSNIMGIDPGEWMRNQGIFMTLATGFGVVTDRAYVMSQQLTQLGYDLASFFNISYEDAFLKLQSGLAGELEPLRRLGFDLSVARLQQEALNLGITKSITAMTQAEKAQLRYYAIMTQVTTAHGDMARTLDAPANQLRILRAELVQATRAMGNLFIPVLNKVLPYCIAFAKVLRTIAELVAKLFHINLPDIKETPIDHIAGGAENVKNEIAQSTKKAKELKNALLGIDELNIISPDEKDDDPLGLGAMGDSLDFELPTYDFINDAVSGKVNEIFEQMKEWLGLTDDINSWADFFHTRLGKILITVGAIGAGLAAWKLTKGLLNGLQTLTALKSAGLDKALTLTVGIGLVVSGVTLETAGIIDAIQTQVDDMNLAQILGGALMTALGGGMIGTAISGAIGGAIGFGIGGVIAGLPAYFVGIYDAIKNNLNWLNSVLVAGGATLLGTGIGALIGALGGPIGAGIGALIGLATGLLTDWTIFIIQHFDEITGFIKNFFTVTIPNIFTTFVNWIKGVPAKILSFVKSLPSKIKKAFDKVLNPIKNYDWENLGHKVGKKLGEALKSAIEFVTVKIPEWLGNIKNAVNKFFTESLPEAIENIKEFLKNLPENIKQFVEELKPAFANIGKAIIDGLRDGFVTIGTAGVDFVGGLIAGFEEGLGIESDRSTKFMEIGHKVINGLNAGFDNIADVMAKITKLASDIYEWFAKGKDGKGIVENFKGVATEILTGFKDKITAGYTTVKDSIINWATGIKEWFKNEGGINGNTFITFALNIIDGFKNKIASYYTSVRTMITRWASNVINWFTNLVSYSRFYAVAKDVVDGFKQGIGNLYQTCKDNIESWGSSIISWFKAKLDSHSPSKIFETIGKDTVLGYNIGISSWGKTTSGVVNDWTDSFTKVTPTMKFAVDTSALKYYKTDSFTKDMSADVSTSKSYSITGFTEGMEEFYKEYVEPTLREIANDTRRQADKQEKTIVQIGNRTVSDVVTKQQDANGFKFTK